MVGRKEGKLVTGGWVGGRWVGESELVMNRFGILWAVEPGMLSVSQLFSQYMSFLFNPVLVVIFFLLLAIRDVLMNTARRGNISGFEVRGPELKPYLCH